MQMNTEHFDEAIGRTQGVTKADFDEARQLINKAGLQSVCMQLGTYAVAQILRADKQLRHEKERAPESEAVDAEAVATLEALDGEHGPAGRRSPLERLPGDRVQLTSEDVNRLLNLPDADSVRTEMARIIAKAEGRHTT
jgi:hypothetical protein